MHLVAIASATAIAAIAPIALMAPSAHASEPNDGFNVIFGSRADDTLFGTRGDDAIFGRAGNDRLVSRGGDDLLYGNQGDDTLIDSSPAFFRDSVVMRGGLGNDLCIGTDNDRFISCEIVIVL